MERNTPIVCFGSYIVDSEAPCPDDGGGDEGFFLDFVDYCKGGTIILIRAFFDESERNGQLCVAGVAFAGPQAGKLTKEFRAVFGTYGGFHMTDLLARTEGYKGISEEERFRLVKEAVRITGERYSYAVAVTVDINEYIRQAPIFIRGLGQAYPFLCHNAMVALKMMLDKHADVSRVNYVFEAGHAYEKEAREFVSHIFTVPELKTYFNHQSDAFIPKPDAVPLQAADLFAYEAMKFKLETVDEPIRKMRISLMKLCASRPNNVQMHFLGGQSLTRALGKYRQLGYEQVVEEAECKRQKELQKSLKTSAMA